MYARSILAITALISVTPLMAQSADKNDAAHQAADAREIPQSQALNNQVSSAVTQAETTNAVAQVTNYPRAETVTSVDIWEAGGSFRRIEWGNLTASKTMASGDTLSFASGAITSALA